MDGVKNENSPALKWFSVLLGKHTDAYNNELVTEMGLVVAGAWGR